VAQLETQVADVQGKVGAAGADSGLVQRLDALTQKVEAIEKKKQPPTETKVKAPSSPKPAVAAGKQVHTVRKGETLSGIGKKYGIGMEELRKLNNLSASQPLHVGQKLVVSPQR
jgi:LysM repeat protein